MQKVPSPDFKFFLVLRLHILCFNNTYYPNLTIHDNL